MRPVGSERFVHAPCRLGHAAQPCSTEEVFGIASVAEDTALTLAERAAIVSALRWALQAGMWSTMRVGLLAPLLPEVLRREIPLTEDAVRRLAEGLALGHRGL